MKTQPATSLVRRNDTHRLIHSKYSDDGSSVLTRIAESDGHLADIFDVAQQLEAFPPAELLGAFGQPV